MLESNQSINHSKCPHSKTYIAERLESYPVKNDKDIIIKAKIRVCSLCGEELFDIKLDTDNLKLAFNSYRELKHLLSTDEIISIRESLNLTQEELDTLIHQPIGTTKRYESGAIQSVNYDIMLRLLSSKECVKILVSLPYSNISKDIKRKLKSL